jgi:hypothetical protein
VGTSEVESPGLARRLTDLLDCGSAGSS